MKKLKRLIELKRQEKLTLARAKRIEAKREKLNIERDKVLKSFTEDEKRLYKEQIIRACKL